MSTRLEQDGLYILPDALGDMDYAILRARQHGDSWQLIETHEAPGGSERFRARAGLPPDELLAFDVAASGELKAARPDQHTGHTVANLSLLGYLRDGRFVEPSTD